MRLYSFLLLFILIVASCQRHSRHKIQSTSGIESSRELVDYLTELIENDKSNAQIFFKRAKAFHELNDNRKALIDIQKALELSPTDPALYLFLSTIYNAQSKPQECINAALQAEQRGLQNYELYRLLAINYLALNEAENAKKSIERLMSFNRSSETLSLKGDIFLQLRDTLEAIKSYRNAIKDDGTSSRPYIALHAIFKESQPAIAEQFVDQYLTVDSEDEQMNLLKARLLTNKDSYDSALKYYNRITLDSTNKDQIAELAMVYFNLANYDTSLFLASKIIQQDSNYRIGALLAARSYDKLRNYNNAKGLYERLLSNDSTDLIVADELNKLNRKVAYLWRLKQQEQSYDSIRNSAPPVVERKDINQ